MTRLALGRLRRAIIGIVFELYMVFREQNQIELKLTCLLQLQIQKEDRFPLYLEFFNWRIFKRRYERGVSLVLSPHCLHNMLIFFRKKELESNRLMLIEAKPAVRPGVGQECWHYWIVFFPFLDKRHTFLLDSFCMKKEINAYVLYYTKFVFL